MEPEHAKRLLRALEDNIGKYERSFGTIDTAERTFSAFGSVKGEA